MKKTTVLMLGLSLMLGTATAFANDDKHDKKDDHKKHLTAQVANADKHDKKDDHKKH